jgi:hypothetical protein
LVYTYHTTLFEKLSTSLFPLHAKGSRHAAPPLPTFLIRSLQIPGASRNPMPPGGIVPKHGGDTPDAPVSVVPTYRSFLKA